MPKPAEAPKPSPAKAEKPGGPPAPRTAAGLKTTAAVVAASVLCATAYLLFGPSRGETTVDLLPLDPQGGSGRVHPVFARVSAAAGADQRKGVEVYPDRLAFAEGGAYASYLLDFGAGASWFTASVAVDDGAAGRNLEVRLDSATGPVVCSLQLQPTGGVATTQCQGAPLTETVSGRHRVFVTSPTPGGGVALAWFKFVRSPRDATAPVPAISYDALNGVEDQGDRLGSLDHVDWARFKGLDFGDGVKSLVAELGAPAEFAGQVMEFRVDGPEGPIIAAVTVQSTAGWGSPVPHTVPVTTPRGVHDVYVTHRGNAVASFYAFRFKR